MDWKEIALRLGAALLLGGLIGFERQLRTPYVGLRTNSLITIGAAGMTLFAFIVTKGDAANIVHIISAIISGIGFLGAGVIVQEGMTVRGCNTAATLWCSVAVGLFVGAGYFISGVLLAAFIMLVNLFLRPITHRINATAHMKKRPAGQSDDKTY